MQLSAVKELERSTQAYYVGIEQLYLSKSIQELGFPGKSSTELGRQLPQCNQVIIICVIPHNDNTR